jgi:hypothetical protein
MELNAQLCGDRTMKQRIAYAEKLKHQIDDLKKVPVRGASG